MPKKTYDGLRPQNLVQAAQADIERRKRNQEIAEQQWRVPYEPYVFLKEHVKNGDGIFGILAMALEHARKVIADPKKKRPRKRLARIIYTDPELIADALELEPKKGRNDATRPGQEIA